MQDGENERNRWWQSVLTLTPLFLIAVTLVGGLSLVGRAQQAGFSGREVVGEAGIDYIVASGVALLAPWVIAAGGLTALGWGVWRRAKRPAAMNHDLLSWLAGGLCAVTVVGGVVVSAHPGQPDEARVVLDTQGRFCARVVLRTPSRVYAEVKTRGARSPTGASAATSFPADKVIALSAPPRFDCGSVNIDKLGG
jgi:hypothetical protein